MSYSIEEANRFRKNHDEKMVRVVKWLEQRDVFAFVSSIYVTEKYKFLYLLENRTQVAEAQNANTCGCIEMRYSNIPNYNQLSESMNKK